MGLHISFQQLQDISENCLCSNTRQLSRALSRIYDRALAPSGLKTTQFSIMVAIGLHRQLPVTKLAAIQTLEHTTLTRNILLLKRRGLVDVRTARGDARIKLVSLTERGEQALAKALPLWRGVQQALEAQFDARTFARQVQAFLAEIEKVNERKKNHVIV